MEADVLQLTNITERHNGAANFLKSLAIGATAGLAGTIVIQLLRTGTQIIAPQTESPMKEHPGKFMIEQAERLLPAATRQRVPETLEDTLGQVLGLAYGVAFGARYGALRPYGGSVARDGVALGLATWATGYLGWLPAMGLMKPVWRQQSAQVIVPIVQHAIYGMTVVCTYNTIDRTLSRRARFRELEREQRRQMERVPLFKTESLIAAGEFGQ
jgi:hypothetical protein